MELDKRDTMNAYHNLAGFLRDVRAVLGDRTQYQLADSYCVQLYDLINEVLEAYSDDDGDMEDADDGSELAEDELIEDGDPPMAVQQPGVSRRARAERRLVGAGVPGMVGRPAPVAGDLPPDVQAPGRRRSRRAPAVAAAGKRGVSRGKK